MRAMVIHAVRGRPEVHEVVDPTCPGRRRGGPRDGHRDVPQRLARVGGPRRDRVPARAGSRAGRRGRGGRRRCRPVGGRRPRDRPVRLRVRSLRVVPVRERPGLSRPAAARLHPLGVVRRVRRPARRGHQPRRPSRVDRLRDRGQPRLPVRHGVPRPRRTCTGHRRRVGDRGRCRRRRTQHGDDRPRPGCPGGRGGPQPRGARRWPPTSARSTRAARRRHATSRPPSPTSREAAATSRSTPWAASRPAPTRSSASAVAVATSRSDCSRRSMVTRGCRWLG